MRLQGDGQDRPRTIGDTDYGRADMRRGPYIYAAPRLVRMPASAAMRKTPGLLTRHPSAVCCSPDPVAGSPAGRWRAADRWAGTGTLCGSGGLHALAVDGRPGRSACAAAG